MKLGGAGLQLFNNQHKKLIVELLKLRMWREAIIHRFVERLVKSLNEEPSLPAALTGKDHE